ncbi:MAG: type III-A CRISPR-associated protein Csm2 [Candidatus Jettenia sp.]|uniref:CRISPR system Cms protein Csm2 n=1 Tax=Candidatus Jettenia caeni TaxID=247490 RepID=I3INX5_9BACT|nr:type III-A CRISPR-associated protein Csm2 [Candidatus Jettenia sp. AMX1]MBC6927568.1 type III-A CRISPR-associated protein Csm2 [Candidatus Jettenia sp.]NUO10439.1 type III-A CRISPR-associated protein Csm2 [Candidatus Brocadia sp.]GAB63420.1 CRISPR-associated protein [Candidatus Jettenia caeni]KAA0251545.1 MAG: type III-A CRISPR-associated protein Csm2 [Candidatus Jettenia sp. AMX1]MCE7881317.1 type III-A CRISPR-associated protein Csm2 [Candidatus Jettenia sp. AMX1]
MDIPKEIMDKFGSKDKQNHVGKNFQNQQYRSDKKGMRAEQPTKTAEIVFRANGQLRRDLLTTDAENWSNLLYDNGFGVTPTALRNFYNEVKALQSQIEAGGFQSNEAMVGLLKSKAAYAYARAENKRKTGFGHLKSMIEQGSDLSKSERDFNDFALFFEAVMGFFKGR